MATPAQHLLKERASSEAARGVRFREASTRPGAREVGAGAGAGAGGIHRSGVGRDCLRWDRHVGSRPPTRRPWSRRGSPRRRCLHAPHRSALSQPRASVARGKALPPKSRSDPNRKDTIVYPTDAVLCRNPVGVCSCWGGEGVVVICEPRCVLQEHGKQREKRRVVGHETRHVWVHIPGRGVSSATSSERSPTAHHTDPVTGLDAFLNQTSLTRLFTDSIRLLGIIHEPVLLLICCVNPPSRAPSPPAR